MRSTESREDTERTEDKKFNNPIKVDLTRYGGKPI
jgi:hypothetical protein